jgi:hypothetical protein
MEDMMTTGKVTLLGAGPGDLVLPPLSRAA